MNKKAGGIGRRGRGAKEPVTAPAISELARLWGEVRAFSGGWDKAKRTACARRVAILLRSRAVVANWHGCNNAACVLARLLPDSEPQVGAILSRYRDALWYELQFQILCELAPDVDTPAPAQKSAARLAADYLHNVPRDTAYAAWMAGHCLGGHIDASVSLPLLLREAGEARFVAGRWAAVAGLTEVLGKASQEQRQLIIATTRKLLRTERSRQQRDSLSWLLSVSAREAGAKRSGGGAQ